MNIFKFEEEESFHSSIASLEDDQPAAPHLNTKDVLALATSIRNCCQIAPPKPPPVRTASNSSPSYADSITSLSLLPTSSSIESGVLGSFRKRLKEQFSKEPEEEDCLSFLVSDPTVDLQNTLYNHKTEAPIEANAKQDKGRAVNNNTEGAGIARVDVYCRSGTVCTIRVLQGCIQRDQEQHLLEGENESIKSSYSLSPSAVLSSLLPTPRTSNNEYFFSSSGSYSTSLGDGNSPVGSFRKSPSNSPRVKHDASVRRIFRRKVNLETLKRILLNPPKVIKISADIVEVEDETSNSASAATSEKNANMNLSGLSHVQQRFLRRERKKYNMRMKEEEKARQKMANLVLSGGSYNDLTKLEVTESKDTIESDTDECSLRSGMCKPKVLNKLDQLRQKQMEIQRKIELADMGLAIITGEVESVEKMMVLLQNERNGGGTDDADDDSSKDASEKNDRDMRHHPREGKQEKKHRGREGKKNSRLLEVRGSSSSHSLSTASKRQYDSFSTFGDQISVSDSSTSLDDSEAEEIARMLQGCEVEYSFPYDFHDDLEDALLAQEFASDYSDGVSGDESTVDRRESKPARRGRNRHRPNQVSKRKVEIPQIISVPTNGHGCVVLRNSGAFSVVGNIPKLLYQELFRKRAPYPKYIAMGTKGRYFVGFEDGTHKCAGPQALKAFLNETSTGGSAKGNNSSRFSRGVKSKKKKGGHHLPVEVASIAFGRRFDDFFLVRSDGSWECNGNMPRSLDELLEDRGDRADLEWVSLGPHDEWCIKAKNERIWWGGVSEEVDDHLSRILIEDEDYGRVNDLKFIDFGVNDAFFLLYQ
ncbi:hypothetical protein ACHAWO_010320 [Cyclotella atomus]|uniref:Uncharacterized protein n=1 Tax=Cyclotella atomus TaxID=382360 RepID=A0ABD3Q9I1_9STRA